MDKTTFIGAGIGYRHFYHQALLSADTTAKPAVLEIMASHFFANPQAIAPIAEQYPLVFHEVGFSPATAKEVDQQILAQVAQLLSYSKPLLFTEHLALTCSPAGIDIGHLAPVWYTTEMLSIVATHIQQWQDVLGIPIALENITAPFVIPQADLSEGEFFTELVARTGCGLLLDLTNLVINAHNFGFNVTEHLSHYPIEAVMQVHLAGGKSHSGWWVDSHSEPVAETSLTLLKLLKGRAPLRAIIVERDERLPPLTELVAEAHKAEQIWQQTSDNLIDIADLSRHQLL